MKLFQSLFYQPVLLTTLGLLTQSPPVLADLLTSRVGWAIDGVVAQSMLAESIPYSNNYRTSSVFKTDGVFVV